MDATLHVLSTFLKLQVKLQKYDYIINWGHGNSGLSEIPASSYVRNAPYQTIYGHKKSVCLKSSISIGSYYMELVHFMLHFTIFILFLYTCHDEES